MKPQSLMKKSAYASRRKIIIYILSTILILGIVAGFTDPFISDNTRHIAGFGETIVMEKEPPVDGTPDDYDLISNLQFAAYKLHHASFFKGVSNGKSVADLGISSYTQNIYNTRVATGDGIVFAETISSSTLKSVAEQKYADNGIIIFRPSTSVNGDKATFADTAYAMSYEDYSANYGTIPNQLSKYVINEETITGVSDLNASDTATVKARSHSGVHTSSDEENVGFDFYVPENLVRGEDGNYLFEITLDPDKSAIYYRNEVRTLAGADNNPVFYSVKLTVCIDEKWNPLYVTVVENYDVAIPVLGAMNCTSTVTETFSDIDAPNGEVPEREFFDPYVEQAKIDGFVPPVLPSSPSSPADYLASAFSEYLSGERDLALTADIKSDVLSAYNAKISVNIKDMDVQALIGSLYFRYTKDRINIKCNNVNGYIDVRDITELTNNAEFNKLTSLLPDLGAFDITALFGGDMLARVFENCEMTSADGITRIRLPFELDLDAINDSLGKASIDASIYIKDDGMALQSISGEVTVAGHVIKIEAKPLTKPFNAPSVNGAIDLKNALEFVPDIINTITSKTFGIKGEVTAQGQTFGIDAYIDLSDGQTVDATVNALGTDISIKYVNDVIYATVGNIDVRGTANDLPALLTAIQSITGTDMNALIKTLKMIMPATVDEFVNMLDSLSVTDNELELGLKFLTAPINIKLTRANGALSGASLYVDFDKFGIKLNAKAELAISYPDVKTVDVPTRAEYITFAQLETLLKHATPYIRANGYDIAFDGVIDGSAINGEIAIDRTSATNGTDTSIAAFGKVSVLGQNISITLANDVSYITLGTVKLKADKLGMATLRSPALELINALVGTLPTLDADKLSGEPIGAIHSLTIDDDGILYVDIINESANLIAAIDLINGSVAINGIAFDKAVALTVDIKTVEYGRDIVAPENANDYIDVATFDVTLGKAAELANAKAFTANMNVAALGNVFPATVAVRFADNKVEATLDIVDLRTNVTLIGDTMYITVGEIKITGKASDINALMSAADGIIPNELKVMISSFMNGDMNIEKLLSDALQSLTSLTVNENTLKAVIDTNELSATINAALDLGIIDFITNVNGERIQISLNGLTAAQGLTIVAPHGEYIIADELIAVTPYIVEYIQASAFSVEYALTVTANETPISVNGNADIISTDGGADVRALASALGQTANITFTDNTAYLELAGIKLKLATTDITGLKPSVARLTDALGLRFELPIDKNDIKGTVEYVLSALKTFDVKAGVISLAVEADGNRFDIALDTINGDISVVGNAASAALELNANVSIANNIAPVAQPRGNFINVASLDVTLDKAAEIINAEGMTAAIEITVGEDVIPASLALSFDSGILKAVITATANGINDPLEITLFGDTLYISLGDIRVKGGIADLPELLEAAGAVLPNDVAAKLDGIVSLMQSGDISDTIDTVLKALTLSQDGSTLIVNFTLDGITARVDLPTDLSYANAVARINNNTINANLSNIVAAKVSVEAPDGEFAEASELIKTATPLLPLMSEVAKTKVLRLSLGGTVSGYTLSAANERSAKTPVSTPIDGSIYIDFGSGGLQSVKAQIAISVTGISLTLTVDDGYIYVNVDDRIKVCEQLSYAALENILYKLDAIDPDLSETVLGIIDAILNTTLGQVLGTVTLSPARNGFALTLTDIIPDTDSSITLTAENTDGVFTELRVAMYMLGKNIELRLVPVYDYDGCLASFETAVGGNAAMLDIGTDGNGIEYNALTDGEKNNYIPLSLLTEYIAPICTVVNDANGAMSVVLSVDTALTLNGKYTNVTGTVALSFGKTLAVEAKLTLFAGTADATELNIVFSDSVVYIQSGNFKLSFDTVKDSERIFEVLSHYLDKNNYLMIEIGKLLGVVDGASAFSNVSLIIDRIKSLANAESIQNAIGLLISSVGNINGDSAAKTILQMLSLNANDDEITVGINAMGLTINITPHIDSGKLVAASVTTNINIGKFAADVKLDVTSYSVSNTEAEIYAPTDEYISIAEFVEAIDNAVSTFTTKYERTDENGNTFEDITVEVETFDFDYDIFAIEIDAESGLPEKDEHGRDKPLYIRNSDGTLSKAIAKKVRLTQNTNGSAFKMNLMQQTDGTYKLNLEAHLYIDIQTATDENYNNWNSGNTLPVTLDLYVVNNEEYPNGLAFIDYLESNGAGERISIDYKSVTQIAASALQILGLDKSTIAELLGEENVQDIDTTVFKSMDIAGLNDISFMLGNIVDASAYVKSAMSEITDIWDEIYNKTSSIEELTEKIESLSTRIQSVVDNINNAISILTSDSANDEAQPLSDGEQIPENTQINGKLYKDIVGGVTLGSMLSEDGEFKTLSADIKNEITTQTEGTAYVLAYMTNKTADNGLAVRNTVERVYVGGLDVNTAKLNKFDLPFSAGEYIQIDLPNNYNQNSGNSTYSNFANIKHLLYDVMNTAGMLEFDIGSTSTSSSDSIHIGLLNVDLHVNAKVKIMDQSEYLPLLSDTEKTELSVSNNNSLPQFMTAAVITVNNGGNSPNLKDKTTQLIFFNNKIYVIGFKVSGGFLAIGEKTTNKNVVYTIDELAEMMNDLDNLLDNFVFLLIPANGVLQSTVKSSIKWNMKYSGQPKTFANIFKGYSFDESMSQHTVNIGLAELAQNPMLSDLTLNITGANNYNDEPDDNGENGTVTDNYVNSLKLSTTVASLVSISMSETLNNVKYDETSRTITSSGLGDVQIYNISGLGSYDFVTAIQQIKNYSGWTPYSAL